MPGGKQNCSVRARFIEDGVCYSTATVFYCAITSQ